MKMEFRTQTYGGGVSFDCPVNFKRAFALLDKEKGNESNMAEQDVLSNQKTILQNQETILANQKTIQDNQEAIKKNQQALDKILKNQEAILANQQTIVSLLKK